MVEKQFIRADQLLHDSFALARMIYDSGFRPDVLLVLWRGGSVMGLAVHEYFLYRGVRMYHAPVKCESYLGIEKAGDPRIEHEDTLLSMLKPASRVLIVDDIFDSGRTISKLRKVVGPRVADLKVATLYLKSCHSCADRRDRPEFWLKSTDQWVVFPHELQDLSPEEIRQKDPGLSGLLDLQQPCVGAAGR